MAEEDKVEIPSREELLEVLEGTPQEPEAPEVTEVELTEVEQQAVEQGWTTKEDWVKSGRDPRQWRPADIWLDRGEFFREINALKQRNRSLEEQVAEAYKHGQKIAEANYKKEIAELKVRREQALEEGDAATALRIQDVIEEKREAAKTEIKAPPKQFGPPPEYNIFLERNPWYQTNDVLQAAADAIGYKYKQANPDVTPADLYWYVEQTMQKEFPQLGKKAQPDKLPPMEGSRQAAKTGSKSEGSNLSGLERNMSDMDRQIMNTLVKTGTFKSKEEYLKEYAKTL